jgi:hypothetical protein
MNERIVFDPRPGDIVRKADKFRRVVMRMKDKGRTIVFYVTKREQVRHCELRQWSDWCNGDLDDAVVGEDAESHVVRS